MSTEMLPAEPRVCIPSQLAGGGKEQLNMFHRMFFSRWPLITHSPFLLSLFHFTARGIVADWWLVAQYCTVIVVITHSVAWWHFKHVLWVHSNYYRYGGRERYNPFTIFCFALINSASVIIPWPCMQQYRFFYGGSLKWLTQVFYLRCFPHHVRWMWGNIRWRQQRASSWGRARVLCLIGETWDQHAEPRGPIAWCC